MATIIYQFADGHVEIIEVSEEMYEAYTKIDKSFNRNEEKHAWRQRKREASFEKLCEEKGFDIVDTAPSIEEQAITHEFLLTFMPLLTENQKIIFKKVYIENKSLRETAREMKIKLGNVQKQVFSIQKKFLKNFSKIGGQNI